MFKIDPYIMKFITKTAFHCQQIQAARPLHTSDPTASRDAVPGVGCRVVVEESPGEEAEDGCGALLHLPPWSHLPRKIPQKPHFFMLSFQTPLHKKMDELSLWSGGKPALKDLETNTATALR